MTFERSTVDRHPGPFSVSDRLLWFGVAALVAAALAATLILVLLPRFGRDVALIDFAVYRWGGLHAQSPDLYRSTVPASSIPGYTEGDLPFIYPPPFAALVFVPFGWLSLSLVQWVSLMVNLAGLAGIAFVAFRAEGVNPGRGLTGLSLLIGCIAAVLEPGFRNLMFGQINIVLVTPGIIWLMPHGNALERGWNSVQFLLGNAYVLLTLAAGTALVVTWLRPRRNGCPRPDDAGRREWGRSRSHQRDAVGSSTDPMDPGPSP